METGLELAVYTITMVRKFPKSLTFYTAIPTATAAKAVYAYLKRANCIYPKTKQELDMRIKYLLRAKAELEVLSTEIDIACTMQAHEMKETAIVKWYKLLSKEMGLVRKQITSDRARFKDLA